MEIKSYTKELEEAILRDIKEVLENIFLVATKYGVLKLTIFTLVKNSKAKDEIKINTVRKGLLRDKKNLEASLKD